ncbi:MAG: hypothetical protein LBG11_10485, partial [Bifidobacteriaceae bacterium]|nr:hypothetical protein [Bifidobacteriaceae bacterium]
MRTAAARAEARAKTGRGDFPEPSAKRSKKRSKATAVHRIRTLSGAAALAAVIVLTPSLLDSAAEGTTASRYVPTTGSLAAASAPKLGAPAAATTPKDGAPVTQPVAAPAVLSRPGGVEVQSRKDYRSVDTGITVFNNTAYIWGYASDGVSGGDGWHAADPEAEQYPPSPVQNLPQGVIVDAAAGIYNFNVLDNQGCVWGWGTYGWHDGSGDRWYAYPPVKIRIGGEWHDTSKPYLCNVQVIS